MGEAREVRTAVLVSGSGTNLQALIDAEARGELAPARLVRVLSNKPGVGALERAARHGIPTSVVPHGDFASRQDFDAAVRDLLLGDGVSLVVLAGYMRLVTPTFLDAFPDRVLNVHPALLPAFPGVDAQEQAVLYGVKVSGCTVHLVDAGTDTGPIVAQSAVAVFDDDTVESLRARVLVEEHRLLPRAVADLAGGRLRRDGRRVLRVRG